MCEIERERGEGERANTERRLSMIEILCLFDWYDCKAEITKIPRKYPFFDRSSRKNERDSFSLILVFDYSTDIISTIDIFNERSFQHSRVSLDLMSLQIYPVHYVHHIQLKVSYQRYSPKFSLSTKYRHIEHEVNIHMHYDLLEQRKRISNI